MTSSFKGKPFKANDMEKNMKQVVLAALLIMGLKTSAVAGIIDEGREAYRQRNFEKL